MDHSYIPPPPFATPAPPFASEPAEMEVDVDSEDDVTPPPPSVDLQAQGWPHAGLAARTEADQQVKSLGIHSFSSVEEIFTHFSATVSQLYPSTTRKNMGTAVRYRIRFSVGAIDLLVYPRNPADTGGTPVTIMESFVPPTAAIVLSREVPAMKEQLLKQAILMAAYLRTGQAHPELIFVVKRPPGRPANGMSVGQAGGNPLGTPNGPSGITPPTQQGYDLVFIPSPDHLPLGTQYNLHGLTGKGQQRVKYEQEMNYPPYRHGDLRAALYFFEDRGLRCYVSNGTDGAAEIVGAMVKAEVTQQYAQQQGQLIAPANINSYWGAQVQ